MEQQQLKEILDKHLLWLDDEEGGENADLMGADLRGANLWGADLRGADLREADLWGAAGNRQQIKSIFASEDYPITYTAEYLQIGCERHEIKEWWEFDDKRIIEMDGKSALKFWRDWKETIQTIIEKSPAAATNYKEKQEDK